MRNPIIFLISGSDLTSRQIEKILTESKTIAVVGLSHEPEKTSHRVASYLQKHGYHIVPVNPFVNKVIGERSYPSLLEIPNDIRSEIDVVDIFRRPEDVPPIVEQAIKLKRTNGKPCVIWMQERIVNKDAAETARKEGMTVVMDKCMMLEHKRLFGKS